MGTVEGNVLLVLALQLPANVRGRDAGVVPANMRRLVVGRRSWTVCFGRDPLVQLDMSLSVLIRSPWPRHGRSHLLHALATVVVALAGDRDIHLIVRTSLRQHERRALAVGQPQLNAWGKQLRERRFRRAL